MIFSGLKVILAHSDVFFRYVQDPNPGVRSIPYFSPTSASLLCRATIATPPCLRHPDNMCDPAAGKKRNFVLVFCKLHIPEYVLTGCLERDAIRNTAPLEHPHLQGNNAGTEHNPVVHVVNACGLDR